MADKKTTTKKKAAGRARGAEGSTKRPTGNGYTPRLKARYGAELRVGLQSELGLGNIMQVPRPEKVVVNMGVGEASKDAKMLDGAIKDLTTITGQKPAMRRARKSIATFKIREGMPVGASVTIRGDRMWDFLDRLLSIVLPRIRDFRGLSPRSFDGRGNYTFGVTEQLVFPEIDYDDIDQSRGMDITIVTTAQNDEEGRALLKALGFPFREAGGGGS
ncbi:MAG: 50S ribosomal protein L5 [Actinomycetota bacterium]|nr:50S ribosomal protein L5 [Actinomycetota bacterium]